MTIRIETPEDFAALNEFVELHDRVYEQRSACHLEFPPLLLPILGGESPFCAGRKLRAFVARQGDRPVARALAVVDGRYHALWNEPLGHLLLFEALPQARRASRLLVDAACAWLREQGMRAVRSGMGMLELPYAVDDYDSLPPLGVRQNPPYYHDFLEEAGFEPEKRWVDYKIEVDADLVSRYQGALEAARRNGFEIVPLRAVPEGRRRIEFTHAYNDAFSAHWGYSPFTEADLSLLLDLQQPLGLLDTSVIAYEGDEPVGVIWAAPESSAFARRQPGRQLRDDEKLNFLGIGVRGPARGRGLNLAMASYAYLELIRRGAKWLSYTMVVENNWPSRRTAEKLGARVCANYLTYCRAL